MRDAGSNGARPDSGHCGLLSANDVQRIQQVVDLAGAGYVEEDFFVSGSGNAYDWAQDGSLSVLASGLPYTTRIMVRRPSTPPASAGTWSLS